MSLFDITCTYIILRPQIKREERNLPSEANSLGLFFDRIAQSYQQARSTYPPRLYDDLFQYAGTPVRRALEIGCGSGQASLPLAQRVATLVCLEPGTNLTALAKQSLASFAGASVLCISFEDWQGRTEDFDLVVAANSLQWIERKTRTAKIAQVLRPGGTLAILRKIPVESGTAVEKQIALALPEILPFQREPQLWPREREFKKSGCFGDLARLRYDETLEHTSDEYVALLSTMNRYQSLPEAARQAGFERICEAVRAHGNRIEVKFVTHLLLARRNLRDPERRRSFFAKWFSK